MKTTRVRVRDTLSSLPVFTCEQVKAIDSAAIANGTPGFTLMTRAGQSAFDLIKETWPEIRSLLVFCGSGNNGGDGYIVAALAAKAGFGARVISAGNSTKLSKDAESARALALHNNVPCYEFDDPQAFIKTISEADYSEKPFVIVDALLGIGFSGSLRSPYDDAIKYINKLAAPVIAIDIPSGLNGNLGCFNDSQSKLSDENSIVRADLTLSFIALKKGLSTGAAQNYIGGLYLDSLGIEMPLSAIKVSAGKALTGKALTEKVSTENSSSIWSREVDQVLLSLYDASQRLIKRAADSHKGSYGRALLIGGASGMGGAILMSAEMCLSGGAGLTSIYTHSSNVSAALVRIPEAMTRCIDNPESCKDSFAQGINNASVLVCGPGLGENEWGCSLFEQSLLEVERRLIPMVLDADALNLLAKRRSGSRMPGCNDKLSEYCVLTPHPGEAARLLGCQISDVQSDRYAAVKKLHELYGGVVVLKGAGTLIFNGGTTYICPYGNPGMSIGGMGDVLSGLIGALLAQGLTALDAANLGVCAHSYAADVLVKNEGEIGLRPTRLIPVIRSVLNQSFFNR